MSLTPPKSTRTDTLVPYTTSSRSGACRGIVGIAGLIAIACRGAVALDDAHRLQLGDGRGLVARGPVVADHLEARSEEHTSELQSLMRLSYAVFCLKKKKLRSAIIHMTKIYSILSEQCP